MHFHYSCGSRGVIRVACIPLSFSHDLSTDSPRRNRDGVIRPRAAFDPTRVLLPERYIISFLNYLTYSNVNYYSANRHVVTARARAHIIRKIDNSSLFFVVASFKRKSNVSRYLVFIFAITSFIFSLDFYFSRQFLYELFFFFLIYESRSYGALSRLLIWDSFDILKNGPAS